MTLSMPGISNLCFPALPRKAIITIVLRSAATLLCNVRLRADQQTIINGARTLFS